MNNSLTYAEELELALLLDGEREDRDTIAQRVLVNRGFAERCSAESGHTMIRITAAGVDKLGEQAKARCAASPPDDVFNGNHGFGRWLAN